MTQNLADHLVAAHFPRRDGALQVGGLDLAALAEAHGTPLFVYDAGIMRARYRALSRALEGFASVDYSVKANPRPEIVRVFREEGAGAEIASGAEFRAALAAGVPPERILFAGPGKSDGDIEATVAGGIGEIHLENREEMARVAAAAARAGRVAPVAIRVNPSAAAQGGAMRMGGKASPFGFDEEALDAAVDAVTAEPRLKLSGLHLFAGTQGLSAPTLLAQWAHGLELAARIAARSGRPLATIDLGGGLGIPYFAGEEPLDLDALRDGLPPLRERLRADPLLTEARVVLEPGRYLVGEAGLYVVRVRAVKPSRGSRFVIADGGMHHHLAASGNLGQIVKRDFPVAAVVEGEGAERSPAALVGPLCTPLDTLARAAPLPELAAGDLVAVLQSGAYGLTASPTGFLGHPLPAEVLVEDGRAVRIGPTA
ncbi:MULTISPECIES: type III PLP-dependent enzyme [Methylobacterium]|uniref:L-glutamyl-[BtrI acyl-carrier protein] decarboxylase n=1 Tax=Methylobacterium jeotgali TaxID=381630 RepID=A0ABQ4T2B3_9HYPH|nr:MULTISPECIES: type III PLP-dependent enzyme [Methylobacterium]PIU06019.1 MAG: type III PLP-dependent enzyme [Methylobacterium sp. CG09_land_8_20_14_0_10_71_15]PIU11780.1 MAG: type III PLP-dependent enzyme [Methylobacterium sp. CG08_land_8_20_14_0_20_71_15]GBU16316.1 diaminopimelate decarboxylase [Methylobacterium sp.]GJE08403.1 L-glutamyl-[BtrI acyl-carrier protein] decarboxylase [Methylobacterium jeotgali]